MRYFIAFFLTLTCVNASCNDDCCNCITGGGGSACASRCSTCSSDCYSCVEYGGGTGCIDDGRCDCSDGDDGIIPSNDDTPSGGCYSMKEITTTQLSCTFPKLSSSEVKEFTPVMNTWLKGLLTTSCDWAAFLGNVGTESDQLTTWTQNPCNSATDAPYCGRGPMQITFSSNYQYCAAQTSYCGCPTIYSDPELVSTDDDTGFGTAACVWGILSGHNLSQNSDGTLAGFKETACYINAGHSPCGDPNGWESRESYWYQANSCLGISEDMWKEDFLKFNKTA
mmetsp:Transcript_11604/g.13985  ORF Transcript_11604/g.13985 Transcript_11604/m.13985 type:complete len:281 (-) Transcript_11604:273-1115(-)